MKSTNIKSNRRINVVTVVLNGCEYLEQTIQSVARQTYSNIGHIIIDGGSTDGTLEIIRRNERNLARWISEPDCGISNAFNKGVRLCQEGYVIFLGDGDYFVDDNAVERIMGSLDKEYELVCGQVQRVADTQEREDLWLSPPWRNNRFNKKSLLFKMSLPHQGLLTHTKFFARYGLFDETCKFAMDYDLLLRAYNELGEVKVLNTVVAAWRAGGIGKNRTRDILAEYDQLRRKNEVAKNGALRLIHWFSIVKYWVRCLTNTRLD